MWKKKIDHPHTAMAYTMAHHMAYPYFVLTRERTTEQQRTRNNPEQQRSSLLVVANSQESKEKTNQKVICEV